MDKTPNYTAAQETLIATASQSATNAGRKLNFDDATLLANDRAMDGKDGPRKPRSITAKINRMGLPYASKEPVRKDGTAVASKADIVAEIGKYVKGALDGLDKAPRPALVALRDALAA